jgi:predicted PurR-regulated permease PerM
VKLSQWIGLLIFIIALYVLWQIRQILLLVFTAIVLATALNQLVERFERSRLRRPWSVFLSIGILLCFLVLFFWLIVPPFIEQFQQLVDLFPAALVQIQNGLEWLENTILGEYLPDIPDTNSLIRQLQPLSRQVLQQSLDVFSTSVTALLQFLLVLVLILMFLSNPKAYRQGLVRLFPSFYRRRANEILDRCQIAIASWSAGALIEMGFIAVFSAVGLWLLQVPLVLAHALLAGLLNFIPNIGPTLSVFLPMTVALLDAPWKAIAVLILYIVIQQVESYWLTPTIMAKQVALLPAITLISQLVFASMFGALGLVMAIPLTVVAKTWIEEVLLTDVMDHWER